MSDKVEEILNLICSDKYKRRIKEYLLDACDDIIGLCELQYNIKQIICGATVECEFVDDNLNNYIKATVHIGNFHVYAYSDYRLNGNKTGGNTYI